MSCDSGFVTTSAVNRQNCSHNRFPQNGGEKTPRESVRYSLVMFSVLPSCQKTKKTCLTMGARCACASGSATFLSVETEALHAFFLNRQHWDLPKLNQDRATPDTLAVRGFPSHTVGKDEREDSDRNYPESHN